MTGPGTGLSQAGSTGIEYGVPHIANDRDAKEVYAYSMAAGGITAVHVVKS